MSTENGTIQDMSTEKILMEIHQTLGHHGGILSTIRDDVAETKKEAKKTNGRVNTLENQVVTLQQQMLQLKGVPHKAPITLDWQKIVLFLGAIATILAYVIEKVWL